MTKNKITSNSSLDNDSINALRVLGINMIESANSGHPGIVLGAAPILYTLYNKHLKINPQNPKWFNRDRFILSAGHGSALLYAINYLSGYQISLRDLKNFRKLGNTPGHPEYGHTEGVEMTTGPLGQGIASAVGFAIAEKHLAAKFNNEIQLIDHYTYVLCGDGDLQEGVTLEALSLAGHLGLGKLIVLFDSNDIQLDGPVNMTYSENNKKKFEAMNWQYLNVEDGNNCFQIDRAIKKAKKHQDQPTIIEIKTKIGFASPLEGSNKVHGTPLKKEEIASLKKNLKWDHDDYDVPEEVFKNFKSNLFLRGKRANHKWEQEFKSYQEKYSDQAQLFNSYFTNISISEDLYANLLSNKSESTRVTSGKLLNALSFKHLNIIGGSADLAASTMAKGSDGNFSKLNPLGRNINYGVREHAMGSIANGIVLHGGLKTFTGAFFVFSDYMKPAIRLAALMKIPTIFLFTHDSIAVGEDGPTHQPIEQLTGLRAIPNLTVIRPADIKETIGAYKVALASLDKPLVMVLTRQNVPLLDNSSIDEVNKGAYIISPEKSALKLIIIASGSEVSLALDTIKKFLDFKDHIRLVSMPSTSLFEAQSKSYQELIIPQGVKTIAIEMASAEAYYKYTNNVYSINSFGVSAAFDVVLKQYGFTVDAFYSYINKLI